MLLSFYLKISFVLALIIGVFLYKRKHEAIPLLLFAFHSTFAGSIFLIIFFIEQLAYKNQLPLFGFIGLFLIFIGLAASFVSLLSKKRKTER